MSEVFTAFMGLALITTVQYFVVVNRLDVLKQKIDKLKGEELRWIPVSEGLPKQTGWYLITFQTYNGDDAVSEMCYRKPENYWTDKNICKKLIDNNEVIAWMPKPKAYKAESEKE